MVVDLDLGTFQQLGEIYTALYTRVYHEVLIALTACPACGADYDQNCLGQYGRRTVSSHVIRRDILDKIRRTQRTEYEEFRENIFRLLLREYARMVL